MRLGTILAEIGTRLRRKPLALVASLCLLFLASCSTAPEPKPAAPPGLPAQIPFELVEGHLYVRARLNQSEEKTMLLDSGSPWSLAGPGQFTNLPSAALARERINLVTSQGVMTLPVLENVEFAFNDFKWPMPVIPVPSLPAFHQDYSGLIGYDLFRDFVVRIVYQGRWIELEAPPSRHPLAGEMTLPLEVIQRHPVVEVVLLLPNHKHLKAKCEIDTGFNGGLALFRRFATAHGLYLFTRQERAAHGFGFSGRQDADPSSIREFQMGRATVNTVVTVLDGPGLDPGEGFDGLLGNGILRGCVVTFDLPHRRLFLRKVAEWDATP